MSSIPISMTLKTKEGIVEVPEHLVTIQDIGKEVQVLRDHLKHTKTLLSDKTGISRSQLWAIEQGKEVPRVETLLQILDSVSHALEVHVGTTVALYDDDIGERLIALRKQSGMTQTELASRAGIYQPHLSAIEQGKHLPRLDTLMSLLDALEAPLKIRVVPLLGNSEEIQQELDQALQKQAALLDEREELKVRLTEVDQKLERLEHKGFTSRRGVIPALQQDLYRSRELEHRLTLPKPVLSNPKGDDYRMARVTPKRFYLVRVPTHHDNYAPGSEFYTSRESLDEWGTEHGLDIDTTLKVWKKYQNAMAYQSNSPD